MSSTIRVIFFSVMVLLILSAPSVKASGFTADASVDRTKIALGESLRLTVSSQDSSSGMDADFSEIKDFDILSRSSSSVTQFFNGKMSENISIILDLSPKKSGILKIPPLKINAGGNTALTKQIEIEVTDGGSKQIKGSGDTQGIFAESLLSQKNTYVGQPVLYTFYLYFRDQIARPNLTLPDFKGIAATELKNPSSYTKNINGASYNVLEKKVLLTPQKAGRYDFDPALLVYEAGAGVRRDVFGFPETVFQRKSLRTESLSLDVKEMPPVPQGLDYSGFAGILSVRMSMEPKELKTGDSGTLAIEYEGSGGRIADIAKPEIKLHDTFKVYPDEPEVKEDTGESGFFGKKTFKVAIVPTTVGEFKLEPLSITYFDTKTGEYRTLSTEPLMINVKAGENKKSASNSPKKEDPKPDIKKNVPAESDSDIFYIKTSTAAIDDHKTITPAVFVFLFLAPPFLFMLVIVGIKMLSGRNTVSARQRAESLSMIKKIGSSMATSEFLDGIHRALSLAASSRMHSTNESFTSTGIYEGLRKSGLDDKVSDEFSKFFSEIEMLRFSGAQVTEENKTTIRELAEKLIRKVL